MVKNEVEPHFYSVGGAVKLGGDRRRGRPAGSAWRRRASANEIDRLQFVHENFFYSEGTPCHELSLYFLMKPKGVKTFQAAASTAFGVERMVWIPIAEYKNHRAYPEFFGAKLADLKPFVEHIVTQA